MKALNILLMILVGFPVVAMAGKKPPVVNCTVQRADLDGTSGGDRILTHTCATFMDPEFGLSAQCDFLSIDDVTIGVTAMGGNVSEMSIRVKGIKAFAETHSLTVADEGNGLEYTMTCSDPK